MRLRLVSFATAVALAAACNSGKDSPKAGAGKSASSSKAAKVAGAIKARGFFLEEADSAAASTDQAAAATSSEQVDAAAVQAILDAEQPAAAQTSTDAQVTAQAVATPAQTTDAAAQGQTQTTPNQVLGQGQATGGQVQTTDSDDAQIFGKPHISRFEITLLSRDNDPIVGAQLAVKKLQNRGKKGYQEIDSFALTAKRTNKFIVWVAAGRHYSIAASAKGYDLLLKELKIDSNRSVNVAFPVVLDQGGSGDDGMPMDQAGMNQQDFFNHPSPTPPPMQGPGLWQWCMRAADGGQQAQMAPQGQTQAAQQVSMSLGDATQAQDHGMKQQTADLVAMMTQVSDPQVQEAKQTLEKMQGEGYHPRNFACGPDNMKIRWYRGKEQITQTVPQAPIRQQFPQGPGMQQQLPQPQKRPVAQQQPQLPVEQQTTVPQAIAPGQQQVAEGLLGCNRETTDFVDVYMILRDAGMTDVIAQLKAKLKAGAHFKDCAATRPAITLGFDDGSTVQIDDASKVSDDFWM